jgi:hypothetical protein
MYIKTTSGNIHACASAVQQGDRKTASRRQAGGKATTRRRQENDMHIAGVVGIAAYRVRDIAPQRRRSAMRVSSWRKRRKPELFL